MISNLKKYIAVLLTVPFLLAHAPWGQHQVYRQLHMLIMCSKKDIGAFEFTKKLETIFNIYLPKAKAKVARAPHEDRIFNLLKTNQIPLALISHKLINDLVKKDEKNKLFFADKTKLIYLFSDMVLIANKEFPSYKSDKIFKALIKASQETNDMQLQIAYDENFLINYDKSIKLMKK